MNTAINNFYLLQPYERKTDDIADAIYKYENTINVDVWRGNTKLSLAKVVSAEPFDFVGSISGKTYQESDLILYDETRIIKHFSDGTKLVRDDAIYCLFNDADNAPGAKTNEVVVKIERSVGLEMQNVVNGFYGTVVDINLAEYWNEKSRVLTVKKGDNVILVNPYRTGSEDGDEVFKKVSTTNGFYVVAEVDAIACKVNSEKE
jgi:hypothetical protein